MCLKCLIISEICFRNKTGKKRKKMFFDMLNFQKEVEQIYCNVLTSSELERFTPSNRNFH